MENRRRKFLNLLKEAATVKGPIPDELCGNFLRATFEYLRELPKRKANRNSEEVQTIGEYLPQIYENLGRRGGFNRLSICCDGETYYDLLVYFSAVQFLTDRYDFLVPNSKDMELNRFKIKSVFEQNMYLTEYDDEGEYPKEPLPHFDDIPVHHYWWSKVAEFRETQPGHKMPMLIEEVPSKRVHAA